MEISKIEDRELQELEHDTFVDLLAYLPGRDGKIGEYGEYLREKEINSTVFLGIPPSNTYEEALEQGLLECLEHVKKENKHE